LDGGYENQNLCVITIINNSEQVLMLVILNYTLPQEKVILPVVVAQPRDKGVSSHGCVVCPLQDTKHFIEKINLHHTTIAAHFLVSQPGSIITETIKIHPIILPQVLQMYLTAYLYL
jgi:hypothetical protein